MTLLTQLRRFPLPKAHRPLPPMLNRHFADRRTSHRQPVTRACKLFRPGSLQYASARTINLSEGGALIEVVSPRPVGVGEKVELGIAWTSSPILSADAFRTARVIRVSEIGADTLQIALQFAAAPALAAVA
jgi:hypothetical protein